MEWIIVIVILVGVVLLIRANNQKQVAAVKREQQQTDDLALVKATANDDVTAFGVALQELDLQLAGHELDEGARADYQRALDCYEISKSSLAAVQVPSEIRNVTAILDDGRYAIACVRARVAGQPIPARRPPCFFDPQHGPSVGDVTWAPAGGTPRSVPACALDTERVEAGAEPATRQVMLGSRRVPYWEAGAGYAPWAAGYFGAFGVMNAVFLGTMMGAVMGGAFDGGGSDSGSESSGSDSSAEGGSDAELADTTQGAPMAAVSTVAVSMVAVSTAEASTAVASRPSPPGRGPGPPGHRRPAAPPR